MTYTGGNVICENIELGKTYYEVSTPFYIEFKVITTPEKTEEGWTWKGQHTKSGVEIDYFVSFEHAHYSAKIYDYMPYSGLKQI